MTDAPGEHGGDRPGTYARYRQIIDDPVTRDALLLQVKGTIKGLRLAYRWHVIASILAIGAMVLAKPTGMFHTYRYALWTAALAIDLVALAGVRTVAAAPTRYLLPLLALDLIVVLALPVLGVIHQEFSIAFLLLFVLPAMLLVYVRDARAIAPLLAEHAKYRRDREAAGDDE